MAALCRLCGGLLSRTIYPRTITLPHLRSISTSKKNRETATAEEVFKKEAVKEEPVPVKNNWITYGFHFDDEKQDRAGMHLLFLVTITVCFVFGGSIYAYKPDYRLKDWAHREAFLELRRREANNLPLIDENLIPVDQINLPTDEELGDKEVII